MNKQILCQREGAIATVTLNNPDKLNAVNAAMWRELKVVMTELSADESLRCVVLRGAGNKAFAAGGDIEEFATLRATPEQARIYHDEWVAGALNAIVECRHPTVALIHGACIGGGLEIAGQCDLRICGGSAQFGVPISKLGFTMAHNELIGLISLAGPALALEMLLEGRILSADEAYVKGLVTRVVADDLVDAEVAASVKRIAAGAPLAARAHKQLVRRLLPQIMPLSTAEIAANFAFLASEDYRTGLDAFRKKIKPEFQGK